MSWTVIVKTLIQIADVVSDSEELISFQRCSLLLSAPIINLIKIFSLPFYQESHVTGEQPCCCFVSCSSSLSSPSPPHHKPPPPVQAPPTAPLLHQLPRRHPFGGTYPSLWFGTCPLLAATGATTLTWTWRTSTLLGTSGSASRGRWLLPVGYKHPPLSCLINQFRVVTVMSRGAKRPLPVYC